MWRLAPFYIAVASAPLLFGGVKAESQAVLGILLGLGLLFTHSQRGAKTPVLPRWLKISLLILILLPLVPFPLGIVKIISPERARLAAQFPIDETIPSWITLSVSPALTIQRLWQICLAGAAFILGRHAAGKPDASRHLAITLATALVLLGASDIWSRQHGRESVLGLWNISWGKGAGTFANRNHFANWIYVAALFCGGWLLRQLSRSERKTTKGEIIFVAAALLFGLAMAFLSASRGGAAAFMLGAAGAAFVLRGKIRRANFGLAASFLIIAFVAVALLFGEKLIDRLRLEQSAGYLTYKTAIWRQTASLTTKFPLFGAGPGSFVRAYNYYKTTDGDGTFWHAENDYLEFPLEYGYPTAILALAALILLVRKSFFNRAEASLLAGLAGALIVFATHAFGEFISFVPANLLLAGALLGFAAGRAEPEIESTARRWPIAALLFLCVSLFQFAAWFEFRKSTHESVQRSLSLWPFAPNRALALLRLDAKTKPNPQQIEARVNHSLQLDPMNWELRLEQAWFNLAFTTNQSRALSHAWLAVMLNPLQGQIPLRFARHFALRDPDKALSFLAAVNPTVPRYQDAALDLAWSITRDPAQLWNLTPDTVPGLLTLARFAQMQKLHGLEAQAAQALEGRVAPEILAEYFLDAQRPEQALRALGNTDSFAALKIKILALRALSRHAEAVTAAQNLFNLTYGLQVGYRVEASHAQLLERHKTNPNDPAAGLLLAEKTAGMDPLNLPLLTALAQKFPDEQRIAYLLFRAQLKSGQTNAASQTAATLVPRLAGK